MNVVHQRTRKWLFIAISGTVSGMAVVMDGTLSPAWAIPHSPEQAPEQAQANIVPTNSDFELTPTPVDGQDQKVAAETIRPGMVTDQFIDIADTVDTDDEAIAPLTQPLVAQNRMSEFGSDAMEVEVPSGNGERITDIQVRFVDDGAPDDGHTRDFIIRREFDLEPGDIYDPILAAEGLRRLTNLDIIREASLSLEPTGTEGEAVMVVTVDERTPFPLRFGLTIPHPTALQGSTEPDTVLPGSNRTGGLSGGVQLQLVNPFGLNQTFAAGLEGGENVGSFALSYTNPQITSGSSRIGLSLNVFNSREVQTIFDGGDNEVQLPNGNDPWVHRLGGGFELFRPLSPSLAVASGFSYQRVSTRDEIFTSDISPEDELGNDLTFSGDGQDDLLTWSFAASWDQRDDRKYPTRGHRFLFRTDQYIPVGDADVLGNRLAANYTQYVPLSLFGFDDGPRTLVLNLQGGTFIGDLPPYEAFSLGGGGSVRGFDGGDVGTGRSFVQATAEYRFPIFDFIAFKEDIDVGGTLFVDYANDLGSGDTVLGEPAEIRDKPGDGLGYGIGLRARTPIGPVRLEFGIADTGDTSVLFNIGDRF